MYIGTIRNFLKKPVFVGTTELRSTTRKSNNTIHQSTKMTPIDGFQKIIEQEIYSNLKDKNVHLDLI